MMWYYGPTGVSWVWMAVTMLGLLLFSGGVFALVIWSMRRIGTSTPGGDSPIDVLRRRLAAGEITPEEFERTRKLLGA